MLHKCGNDVCSCIVCICMASTAVILLSHAGQVSLQSAVSMTTTGPAGCSWCFLLVCFVCLLLTIIVLFVLMFSFIVFFGWCCKPLNCLFCIDNNHGLVTHNVSLFGLATNHLELIIWVGCLVSSQISTQTNSYYDWEAHWALM